MIIEPVRFSAFISAAAVSSGKLIDAGGVNGSFCLVQVRNVGNWGNLGGQPLAASIRNDRYIFSSDVARELLITGSVIVFWFKGSP